MEKKKATKRRQGIRPPCGEAGCSPEEHPPVPTPTTGDEVQVERGRPKRRKAQKAPRRSSGTPRQRQSFPQSGTGQWEGAPCASDHSQEHTGPFEQSDNQALISPPFLWEASAPSATVTSGALFRDSINSLRKDTQVPVRFSPHILGTAHVVSHQQSGLTTAPASTMVHAAQTLQLPQHLGGRSRVHSWRFSRPNMEVLRILTLLIM